MAIGFVRIGKLTMATVGTIWTVLNVESLYTQTKHFLYPSSSSYPFLFFQVILLSILFQCSSYTSRFTHLLLNLPLFTTQNSTTTTHDHQAPPVLDQLPHGFSDIWSRIMDHKEDHETRLDDDQFTYSEPTPIVEDDKEGGGDHEVILEEEVDVGEDGKDSMEETWKAIMEGKLKKCNTWDVTPSIDQMRGKPVELDSSKSFALEEEFDGGKDSSMVVRGGGKQWGWRRMEVVLPRDEINQRAEEFINKIKNNIRLERLESYNLFLQLINRQTS